jgi:hypothetical protein
MYTWYLRSFSKLQKLQKLMMGEQEKLYISQQVNESISNVYK